MTYPGTHETKARHVKNTWAKHCDILYFVSSIEDDSFPTIALHGHEESKKVQWKKTR